MQVILLSPDREIYNGEAERVKLPGKDGKFEVLNNHAPLVSSLTEGRVIIDDGQERQEYGILSGFVEVLSNVVSILVQEKVAVD